MIAISGYTKVNLYSKLFFRVSCIANILSYIFTFTIVSGTRLASIAMGLIMVYMLVESYIVEYSHESYNSRYASKIVMGIVLIALSVVYVDRDYILFLPIIMGLLYLNVNSIIKSKFVNYMLSIFVVVPIVKIYMFSNYNKYEYIGVLVTFMFLITMSNMLFRLNSEKLFEVENRAETTKEIVRLMNHLVVHNVRNELQNMQILCKAKYRNDIDLFIDTMHEYQQSISRLVDSDIFDNFESIDVKEIINGMNHIIGKNLVDFDYTEKDNTEIATNKNVLYSTIKNFIENSIEASRKFKDKKSILIVKEGKTIKITDSCGGFDVSNIKVGSTTKSVDKRYHGVFLKTITDESICKLFGFAVTIKKIDDGTEIEIKFV